MKKLLLLSTLCSLFIINGIAQNGWVPLSSQHNSFTSSNFKTVGFFNSDTGLFVGAAIFQTLNNGNALIFKDIVVNDWITDMQCYANSKAIIVTDSGVIYTSTNFGNTWFNNNQKFNIHEFYSVQFINDTVGFIAGSNKAETHGILYKTTNGGASWNIDSFPSTVMKIFKDIYFVNADTGYAVGIQGTSNVILRTYNGGTSWTTVYNTGTVALKTLYFTSVSNGFAAGQFGLILKTTDKGANWSMISSGVSVTLNKMQFVNSQIGFIVGNSGKILKTINGGTNWVQLISGTSKNLNSLHFPTPLVGYVVGDSATVLRTTSAGYSLSVTVPDYTITCSDSVQLVPSIVYNGTGTVTHSWQAAPGLSSTSALSPWAKPLVSTQYIITVTDGQFTASDTCTVTVNPIPVDAGNAVSLNCQGTAQLQATVVPAMTNVAFSWMPTTGLSNPNIANPIASPFATTTYFVTASKAGCSSVDSVLVSIIPLPPDSICLVTTSDSLGENVIVFQKKVIGAIAYYKIYRETFVANVYDSIGFVHADSMGIFVDTASNPLVHADRYRISVVDSCGLESAKSPIHKTMHLTINSGAGSTWNLIWNPYEGFPVPTYRIWRGKTTANMIKIDSVPGTSFTYTDLNPPSGGLWYQVEVIKPGSPCNPAKAANYNSSRSNQANNGMIAPIPLKADFIASVTTGTAPLTVQFSDFSMGSPVSWFWNCGNSLTFNVQNPLVIYNNPGQFDVKLKVSNQFGDWDSITKPQYISVYSGIEETFLSQNIFLKPNPTPQHNNLTLLFPEKIQLKTIRILTVEGKKMKEVELYEGKSPVTIQVDEIPQGLYILQLVSDKGFVFPMRWIKL